MIAFLLMYIIFLTVKSEYSHFDSLKSHKVHTTYASLFLSADGNEYDLKWKWKVVEDQSSSI